MFLRSNEQAQLLTPGRTILKHEHGETRTKIVSQCVSDSLDIQFEIKLRGSLI